MIEAKKNRKFEKILELFLTYQLRKHFHRVYVDKREWKKSTTAQLILMNHSSWWDGLMCFYVNRKLVQQDSYAMMSEEGLQRFPFFQKIGAFSVNPKSPKDLVKSLKYSKEKLQEGSTVWLFPQGEEEHLEKRPLTFMSGPAYLIEQVESLSVVNVLFYYTFTHHQQPELYIKLVGPYDVEKNASRKDITLELQQLMAKQLDELKEDIISEKQHEAFEPFLSGRKSVSEWLEWLKTPLKGEKNDLPL